MRETFKERRRRLGAMPMPRLVTMVLMLAILTLIFTRLRDPSTWRMFSRDDDDSLVVTHNESSADKQPAPAVHTAAASSSKPVAAATKPGPQPSDDKKTAEAEKAPAVKQPVAANQPAAAAGQINPKASVGGPNQPAPAPAAPPQTPPELTATGSTDEDPMEWEDMKTYLPLIVDGSLEMTKQEMPAYFQILSWVDHQPLPLLRKRAHKDVTWNDFHRSPNSMRLQLVELRLSVRQILRAFGPPVNGKETPITTLDGKQIYQVCGFTQESGSNMYFGIVTELPEGMPIGTYVNEDCKLVGYFFKLQGYFSQAQQLAQEQTGKKQRVLKAPVIMGRVVWLTAGAAAEEQKTPFWLLVTIGSVATVIVIGWVLLASRKSRRRTPPVVVAGGDLDFEGPAVDNWLDQAQSGRLALEPVPEVTARSDGAALGDSVGNRFSGNIFGDNGESSNGRSAHHGEGTDNGHSSHNPYKDTNNGLTDNGHGGTDSEVHDQEP